MNLTSFLSIEGWEEFERTIHDKYNLESSVFNLQGVRITNNKIWVNKLCPAIKSTSKGQSFICAVAHMNLANQANHEKRPIIEQCDAGLVKIVVPILLDNVLLGTVGACGLLPENGEIDSFLIEKITNIDEKKIIELSENIKILSERKQGELAQYVWENINHIISKNRN